jgi:hypothetical protein
MEIRPEDIPKTTFVTRYKQYEFTVIIELTKLYEHKYKNKRRNAQIFELEPI